MIDLSLVVTRLQTQTPYQIELAKSKEPSLIELSNLPVIFIGYGGVEAKNPRSPIEFDLFNLHGEDLVQTFDIQIVCEAANLSTIWKTIYPKLIGWNPVLAEANYSGLTYSHGGVIGMDNSRLWWIDKWKIGFPVVSVSF